MHLLGIHLASWVPGVISHFQKVLSHELFACVFSSILSALCWSGLLYTEAHSLRCLFLIVSFSNYLLLLFLKKWGAQVQSCGWEFSGETFPFIPTLDQTSPLRALRRGWGAAHFIPHSLASHLKRHLALSPSRWSVLHQEPFRSCSPSPRGLAAAFILCAISQWPWFLWRPNFSLVLVPELRFDLLPLSHSLLRAPPSRPWTTAWYIHSFSSFSSNNFLVHVHVPFAVPVICLAPF